MGAPFTSSRSNGARHERSSISPAYSDSSPLISQAYRRDRLAAFNLDLSGRVRSWSASTEGFAGYVAQDIVGRPFAHFFTASATAAGEPSRILEAAAAEGCYEHIGRLVGRDGSVFSGATMIVAVLDSHGWPDSFTGTLRDLTNENAARHGSASAKLPGEIEQRGSLLGAVVESSAAAIMSCDNELRITSWNRGAKRIFGYNARAIVGQPIHKLMPPKFGAELDELLRWMRHGEQLRDFETHARRKDGSLAAITMTATPMIDADGDQAGISILALDISAGENARRKLEEAQRWLRQTVNHAPILITATDEHGIYTMAEGQALGAFGISGHQALVGQSALELMGPDAPSASATRQALAGATIQTTIEINGHFFEIWKAPQRNAYGHIVGTLSVNTDVTRRVTIERELHRRLRQQETIAAIGKSALSGESFEWLIRRAAESACEALKADLAVVWRRPADSNDFVAMAISGPVAAAVAPSELLRDSDDSLASYAIASRAPVISDELAAETRFTPHPASLRLGLASTMEIAFGPVNGDWALFSAYSRETGRFGSDDASFIEAIAHVLTSAAANAEARQNLQVSEAYFRRLIENVSDVVTVVDRRGLIRSMGGAVEQVFGISAERLRGTPSIELVAAPDQCTVREASKIAFAHPGQARRIEFAACRSDGTYAPCEVIMKAVTDLGDEPMLLVSLRDITERKRNEETVARARDAALEAARLKSVFLANMSHEVRTPINIIMGYSDLVAHYLAGREDDSQSEFLAAIGRAGRRLLRTIDAILDYSKLSSKSLELSPELIRLGPLIERQLQPVQSAAEDKNLTLAWVNDAADAEVWCDEYCLTRALQHLLDNAIKFTHQGEVRVRAYRDHDDAMRIDIIDTGIGIDAAFLPRLLEPFSQEDAGFSRRFEGSGLGLALARGYLECNGARLLASSEKGAGSTFSLIFPQVID